MARVDEVIGYGTHADRPAAGGTGSLYYETDTDTLFRDNGSTWDTLTLGGGSSSNLLALHSYAPGSDGVIHTTASTSFVDVDATNAAVTFTAPSSGIVVVRVSGMLGADSTGDSYWGLREATTNIASAFMTGSSPLYYGRVNASFVLTSVSAGSHTYKLSHRTTSGNTLVYGGPGYGALVFEVYEGL